MQGGITTKRGRSMGVRIIWYRCADLEGKRWLKLAEGVMIDAVVKKLRQYIPRNTVFGSGPQRRAEAVIGALRQKSMEDPGGAVVATDLSNACGSM